MDSSNVSTLNKDFLWEFPWLERNLHYLQRSSAAIVAFEKSNKNVQGPFI